MASNQSVSSQRIISERVVIVQVLIIIFLYINCLMIATFFMKDVFYRTVRYILFTSSLMSDSFFLIITNLLLILSYVKVLMPMWMCLVFFILSSLYNYITPLTLTAMTLERYVAICMPLRHGQLCSPRSALHCILVIHSLSFFPCVVMMFIVVASVSFTFYNRYTICTVETILVYNWQNHLRSAISQFYFLVMFIVIAFSYIKIMQVAQAASAEDKKSSLKGLRTVMLHAFQLILCLIQLWCPFVEAALLQINILLYMNVRYFNYIMFIIVPRCLSPLVYGLRDEKFYQALKHYALWCLYNKKISVAK